MPDSNVKFDYPSQNTMVDANGLPTAAWEAAFSRWHDAILKTLSSGTTAKRPTTGLTIGQQYFDTTLGKAVNLKSVRPNVWVDGVGTVS